MQEEIDSANNVLWLILFFIEFKYKFLNSINNHLYFNKLNYFFERKICKHMENRYLKAFLILLNQWSQITYRNHFVKLWRILRIAYKWKN